MVSSPQWLPPSGVGPKRGGGELKILRGWLIVGALVGLGALVSRTQQLPPANATDLSVTIVAYASPTDQPRFVSTRDSLIGYLQVNLPGAWKTATRGLGSQRVMPDRTAITVKVIAAQGTSVHRSASNRPADVHIYVADDHGALSPDNAISTTLHELGHIWCCRGEGTSEGHWLTAVSEGKLIGLNEFGLMNSPVECQILKSREFACPSVFSERDLLTMGFAAIPRATNNTCVVQVDQRQKRVQSIDAELAQTKSDIDSLEAQIKRLAATGASANPRSRQAGAGSPAALGCCFA